MEYIKYSPRLNLNFSTFENTKNVVDEINNETKNGPNPCKSIIISDKK